MSRPSPGWMMLPTTQPDRQRECRHHHEVQQRQPADLADGRRLGDRPTPTTIVQKMIGAIIILMSATNPVPIGLSATPTSGQMQADRRAEHDRDDHRYVEPGVLVPAGLAAPPVVAGQPERLGLGNLTSHLRLRLGETSLFSGRRLRRPSCEYCGPRMPGRSGCGRIGLGRADARRRMAAATGPSAASRVFLAFLAAVVAIAALLGRAPRDRSPGRRARRGRVADPLARPHHRGGSRCRRRPWRGRMPRPRPHCSPSPSRSWTRPRSTS